MQGSCDGRRIICFKELQEGYIGLKKKGGGKEWVARDKVGDRGKKHSM